MRTVAYDSTACMRTRARASGGSIRGCGAGVLRRIVWFVGVKCSSCGGGCGLGRGGAAMQQGHRREVRAGRVTEKCDVVRVAIVGADVVERPRERVRHLAHLVHGESPLDPEK